MRFHRVEYSTNLQQIIVHLIIQLIEDQQYHRCLLLYFQFSNAASPKHGPDKSAQRGTAGKVCSLPAAPLCAFHVYNKKDRNRSKTQRLRSRSLNKMTLRMN